MKCPFCGSWQINIVDSRPTSHNRRRRRYECADCGERFTTYEYLESDIIAIDEMAIREEERKKTFQKILDLAQAGRR